METHLQNFDSFDGNGALFVNVLHINSFLDGNAAKENKIVTSW